jgi:dTDP-4-dehydrorhamnose reductase
MRILITGITGLLGLALQDTASNEDQLFGIYHPERELPVPLRAQARAADVSSRLQMQTIFEWAQPDFVIHTAAIGSVDFAEKNREQTHSINVGGTQVVTELCSVHGIPLLYVSSNAVFDGKNPPYSESDPVSPISSYGLLKVEAENVVRSCSSAWTIVRPILMYGWPYPGERDNPVTWWIRLLGEQKPIKVVDNVYSKPLYSHFCAEVIWATVRLNCGGIFHVAGADRVSLYEFALTTADIFGLDRELITPVPDTYFSDLAPRPRDTSFVTAKIEHQLSMTPISLRAGLGLMKKRGGFKS